MVYQSGNVNNLEMVRQLGYQMVRNLVKTLGLIEGWEKLGSRDGEFVGGEECGN